MVFSNWSDFNSSSERFEVNVAALDMINLLDEPEPKDCASNLQEQDSLAAFIVDEVSGDLILIHHITRIGKSLKKKSTKSKEKIVTLSGLGSTASPIRLAHWILSVQSASQKQRCHQTEFCAHLKI